MLASSIRSIVIHWGCAPVRQYVFFILFLLPHLTSTPVEENIEIYISGSIVSRGISQSLTLSDMWSGARGARRAPEACCLLR